MSRQGQGRRDVLKATAAAAVAAGSLGAAGQAAAATAEVEPALARPDRRPRRVAHSTASYGDMPPADYARNMRLIGHTDQGGRADGIQIMVHRAYA